MVLHELFIDVVIHSCVVHLGIVSFFISVWEEFHNHTHQ